MNSEKDFSSDSDCDEFANEIPCVAHIHSRFSLNPGEVRVFNVHIRSKLL